MSKVAIVYWSGTGNTEAMADLIAQGVRAQGGTAELIHASSFNATRLDDFDAFAFGCPAMGDEELEDMEFLPMYDEVEPLLAGRDVVLFGSYEWNDGEWMELWEQRAEAAGVNVVDSVAAYDYPDDEASAECVRVGGKLAA
ncbi:flavodoxin [Eggerthella sinensis]|jgi:flavodoxin I|uniref:Flavodoxin n=1 Tax=Eggerthella sinensis TaxID=242230 RepID=A0A3N0IXL8_9ACTN|nr:flavodoxin [Eggerthella sinensis]MCB7037569.1 flavodoxin [Eggerthella sinensis]RDB67611.1 flavodoxin [Eggerthella sinensis]RNM41707.1 flavodoxin [Eggerthella sinensis]